MRTKQDILAVSAGALAAVSVFTFADGAVLARQNGWAYTYLMYLPQILCFSGGLLLQFVKPATVIGSSDAFEDESEEVRSKGAFFISAVMFFASLTVAVWKLVDPYSSMENPWPGVAIVVQVILLTISFGLMFARGCIQEEEESFF